MGYSHHCLAEKVQALTLLEWGMPPRRVAEVTNFSARQLCRLREMARKRGYDPSVSLVIKDEYLAVAPRSGRPKKIRPEKEGTLLAGPHAQPPAPSQGDAGTAHAQVTNNARAATKMPQHTLNQGPNLPPITQLLGMPLDVSKNTETGK